MAQPPLILIVDDNLDAREMYGMYLEHEGFRWAEAIDGHDALLQTQAEKPALILMHAPMPRMDGWEPVRLLNTAHRPERPAPGRPSDSVSRDRPGEQATRWEPCGAIRQCRMRQEPGREEADHPHPGPMRRQRSPSPAARDEYEIRH